MIVTAALAWYAETSYTLDRCVRSLEGFCDNLVALGGRWEGFPAITGDTDIDQAITVVDACRSIGITHDVRYGDIWASQVEKRAELMRQAARGSDWILVIDADEYIDRGDPPKFRSALAETERDVARVFAYRIPLPYGRNIHRVYRSSTNVTVERAHNGYKTDDGRFLNGDPAYVKLAPHEDVGELLVIAHDLECRSENRLSARRDYNRVRRKQRLEAWV